MKTSHLIAVCILMLLVGFFASMLIPDPELQPLVITHTDTIPGDSIPYKVTIRKTIPVFIDTGILWRYLPVDTFAILADYYSRKVYIDTLKNDTSALVVVIDTVTENQLQCRSLVFQNRRPVAINTTIISNPSPLKRWELFAGVTSGILYDKAILGGTVMVLSPNRSVVQYTYAPIGRAHLITFVFSALRQRRIPP